jgi:hypothetical protein
MEWWHWSKMDKNNFVLWFYRWLCKLRWKTLYGSTLVSPQIHFGAIFNNNNNKKDTTEMVIENLWEDIIIGYHFILGWKL